MGISASASAAGAPGCQPGKPAATSRWNHLQSPLQIPPGNSERGSAASGTRSYCQRGDSWRSGRM